LVEQYSHFSIHLVCLMPNSLSIGTIGVATGFGLDERGVGVGVPGWTGILTSPRRPDRLWGPPSLLSNGYRRLFPQGQSGGVVKLTIHLQVVHRWKKQICIYSVPHMSSRASTGQFYLYICNPCSTFFKFPIYLQSVIIHLANCGKC
jgi:hypothetical protein